jgi:hypothetical protein
MSSLFFAREESGWHQPLNPIMTRRQRRKEHLPSVASVTAMPVSSSSPAGDGTEPPLDDSIVTDATKALAYTLFAHPAVVETVVTSIMGRCMLDTQDSPIDTIKRTWDVLLEHKPILQIRVRETVNYLNEAKQPIYSVSTFQDKSLVMDYSHQTADLARLASNAHEFHFECDCPLIEHAMLIAEQKLTRPWLIRKRLATIMAIIFCTKDQSFAQQTTMRAVRIAVLSQFRKNAELAAIYDASIYVVAVLRFVLRHIAGLLASLETSTPPHKPEEADAISKTITELFDACGTFVQTHQSMQNDAIVDRPAASRVLEEAEQDMEDVHPDAYRPWLSPDESEEHLFGVPMVVLESSKRTLHWLHQAWANPRYRPDLNRATVESKEEEEEEYGATATDVKHPIIGLRRLVDDLWRAKSLWLVQDYEEFIMDWDKKYLLELLESQGIEIPDEEDDDDDEEDEEDAMDLDMPPSADSVC